MNLNTTPRKVKQESRLRRSLSLTNTNNNNSNNDSRSANPTDNTMETELDVHLNGTTVSISASSSSSPFSPAFTSASSINYLSQDRTFIENHRVEPTSASAIALHIDPTTTTTLREPEPGEGSTNSHSQNGLYVLSQQQTTTPPPYRLPPSALGNNSGPSFPSFFDLPNSVPDHSTYQTHSSKFPIVREVIFSKESGFEPHPKETKIPTLSQYHKIQNRHLTTKQIAWTDERKAFTLDSSQRKDFQERLLFSHPTITRRNSLDLEKFLKLFNEESSLMASMQGGRINNMEGVDNPALDLGLMPHGHSHTHSHSYSSNGSNKMSGYFPDSSNSQSLSLSSSNTDSMDTVIYKGPTQPSPSIRDWQRSIDSNLERSVDFNHRSENNNSYRDSSVFVDSRSYQIQSQTSSYQPLQFNGPGVALQNGNGGVNDHGNFAMEYHRTAQQAQQQLQSLSVQSIPANSSSGSGINSNVNNHLISNGNNGMSNLNALRVGNNTNNNNNNNKNNSNVGLGSSHHVSNGGISMSKSYGSNPQLSSKSPLLTQKQFSPVSSSSSPSNAVADLNHMLDSKATSVKDSSKLFHNKTYHNIKDMLSSRFGAASSNSKNSTNNNNNNSSKSVNNTNGNSGNDSKSSNNNNSSNQNQSVSNGPLNNNTHTNINTNSGVGVSNLNSSVMNSNPNSYIDSSYNSYGISQQQQQQQIHPQHHHLSVQNASQNSYGVNSGSYYASPPTQSPPSAYLVNGNGHPHIHQQQNTVANSYRSPPLSDRKNVNTSFRKAIQKSTQKSNLESDSVPTMRAIIETSASQQQQQQQQQQNQNIRERDLYRSAPQYTNNNSSSMDQIHQNHQQQQQQLSSVMNSNSMSTSNVGLPTERAQRALEKLCEAGVSGQAGQFQGSSSIIHSHQQQQQQQQQQQAYNSNINNSSNNNNRLQLHQFPTGTVQDSRSPSQSSVPTSTLHSDNLHSRHKFNVKGGLSSPSNINSSSSGLTVLESTHSVSYSKSSGVSSGGIANEAFQGNDEYNEPPPPLPTSQQPGLSLQQQQHLQQQQQQQQQQQHNQDINTVGLPVLAEKRENGDGSSGSMETSTKLIMEPNSGNLQSEQLKQITSDLQNLAMSVSAGGNGEHQSSSSECEKGSQRVGSGQSHTTTDSGRGTVLLAKESPLHLDPSEPLDALIAQRQKFNENIADSISSGNDSEQWVDVVEPEIRTILEMEKASKASAGAKLNTRSVTNPNSSNLLANHTSNTNHNQSNGNQANQSSHGQSYNHQPRPHHSQSQGHSGILSDMTSSPPPLSKKSPALSPKSPKKFDLNAYNKKEAIAGTSQQSAASAALAAAKAKSPRLPTNVNRSNSNSGSGQNQRLNAWSSRQRLSNEKGKSSSRKDLSQHKPGKLTRSAMSQILYSLHDDNGDITSTTTGLDLESMLDGPTENTSDDDDLSTTIDTTDAYAIRRQLESLESTYTEILKVLSAKKFGGNRYPSSDLRNSKRRPYGSMSSLPSSVSSRPFKEKSKKVDDKKKVKDLKSINRRFQRLESHVVTLARSVAHLSSEMRTQHLMVQEMESIRNEMSQLRSQVIKASMQNHAASQAQGQAFGRVASGRNGAMPSVNPTDWASFRNALPSLTNPSRVKKLTKFFGDEPPLIRIFLKKLGYEKYAAAFEQERIGIMELPYLTEERLNKLGIPLGPRLRILQESHNCLKPHHHDGGHQSHHNNHAAGNLSVYVV